MLLPTMHKLALHPPPLPTSAQNYLAPKVNSAKNEELCSIEKAPKAQGGACAPKQTKVNLENKLQ